MSSFLDDSECTTLSQSRLEGNIAECTTLSQSSLEENIANISMPSTFLETSKLTDDASIVLTPNSRIGDINNSLNWSINSSVDTPAQVLAKPEKRNPSLCNEILRFRRLSQDVNHSRMRYNRTRLLMNVMEDLFSSSTELPDDLKTRCLNRLHEFQLDRFLKCNPDLMKSVDVDIPTGKFEMTIHEGDLLRSVMKKKVAAKCSQLKSDNELISNLLNYQKNRVTLPGSILTEEEGIILDRISEMASVIETVEQNLQSVLTLHDDLYELRATKLRDLEKTEVENVLSKTKLLTLQMRNLNYAIEDVFVQQYDKMSEAVDVLHRELQVSLHEAEYMTQKTRSLKDKYDQIKGSKFDEILNEYRQLRDNYKHKSWALKQIKGAQ